MGLVEKVAAFSDPEVAFGSLIQFFGMIGVLLHRREEARRRARPQDAQTSRLFSMGAIEQHRPPAATACILRVPRKQKVILATDMTAWPLKRGWNFFHFCRRNALPWRGFAGHLYSDPNAKSVNCFTEVPFK
jgi:hypothetical protein